MIAAEAQGAWKTIEHRLRPYVARRVASAADVDDIVQEVLVRLHDHLASLRDGERFGGWVYRIAQNAIADLGRRRARDPLAHDPTETDVLAEADGDDSLRLVAELGECVALFVARLPSPYREAITLTELEGLTQAEAARMLGISLSGMKSRVQRGREKLRELFDQCCEISIDCRGRIIDYAPRRGGC